MEGWSWGTRHAGAWGCNTKPLGWIRAWGPYRALVLGRRPGGAIIRLTSEQTSGPGGWCHGHQSPGRRPLTYKAGRNGRRRAAFAAFGLNNKAVLQSADSHAHQHLTHPGVPEQSPESRQSQSPSPPGMSCHLAPVASRFIRPPWRLSRDGGGTLPVLGLASDRPRRAPPCRGQDHGLPWTRDASCHIIHQPSATGRATPARHAINRARHGHSGTNTRTPSTAISGTLLRHAGLAAG